MYHYQSDTTKFLNEFLQQNPEIQQTRLQHRKLLWDVELNSEDESNFAAAKLLKKPYPYLTE
ncbi:DUF3460 family protein [Snodgrassella sp. B3882]|uniref:DUF3460 family protein n=1 Tax=Snodgrassella sp. B3882 TaxID=2818037 RepID=UPI00226A95AE|nr:DUF3460 family protein [Snodgrassella sp. B3882]MCX8745174.1 DUF3460 family protein [Snodgrassella sp. B3882]